MKASRTVRIRWSNGSVTAAAGWQELLDKVREGQWHDWDEFTFRQVLAKRAARWSGTDIDWEAPPEEFFVELERAQLIEILNPNDNGEER